MPKKHGICLCAHAYHQHDEGQWLFVVDYEKRVKDIKNNKPPKEQELRLKLFKPVEVKIGDQKLLGELYKAREACDKAWGAYLEAREAYYKAGEACDKAGEACDKAGEDYDKAGEDYDKAKDAYYKAGDDYNASIDPVESKILHDKICGCKYFEQGNNIFKDGR